jgi:hypothetical protein
VAWRTQGERRSHTSAWRRLCGYLLFRSCRTALICRLKQIHDLWIELRSSSLRQLGKRHIYRKRGTIDAIRGHSVKRISHRDDASAQRNPLALETIRVS